MVLWGLSNFRTTSVRTLFDRNECNLYFRGWNLYMSDTTERYISSKASHNDSDETASDEEEKNIVSHSDLLESETGLFHIYNVTRW